MYVLTTTCAKCPTVESWIGNGPTGGHQMRHRLPARVVSMKAKGDCDRLGEAHRVTLSRGAWVLVNVDETGRADPGIVGIAIAAPADRGPGRIVASGQHLELGICQEGRSRRRGWHDRSRTAYGQRWSGNAGQSVRRPTRAAESTDTAPRALRRL